MKTPEPYVSKSQLLDYVSKREFNDFKEEMRDFRAEFDEFRNHCTKRFNDMERRFDELKEEFRIHTGAILEQMREDHKIIYEYIKSIEAKISGKA